MHRVIQAAFVALLVTSEASAETMKAIRKGLLCEQADALAKLTLPDGGSRTDTPQAKKSDIALKESGGCIDIPDGALVTVQSKRKRTSIVTFNHNGVDRTFITPNIDYAEITTSAQMSAPTPTPHISVMQTDNRTVGQHGIAPDITGIRLGMTLKQAESIIGPDYKYVSHDGKTEGVGPGVEVLFATKNPSSGQQPEARTLDGYAVLALDDKIFFVEHGQEFADADMPNTQKLETALVDKYGKPSLRFLFGGGNSVASMTRWLYSPSNELISPTNEREVVAQRAVCELQAGSSPNEGNMGQGIPHINDFRGPPGMCVFAQINPAQNQEFVHQFTVYLLDQGPMLQQLGQLQKEKDAQARAAIEASKTKVPKL